MSEPLFFIALFLGIVPFIQLLLQKNDYSQTLFIKPFVWLVFLSSIYEFTAFNFNWNSAYWFRFYTLFDFLFIFYFYYNTLEKRYAKYFTLSITSFLVLYTYLLFIWDVDQSTKTEFYLTTFESFFVVISSVLWFITIFVEMKEDSLLNTPNYYFIAGFVAYFTGTFFLYMLSDFMMKFMISEILTYWNLIIIFNIILRTLLITGIWKAQKK